ncbi:hypothetical protein Nepgr_003127 [Nepenthes gracilis]|uniref:CASP-like protein n=1 Tax=Nepenthes gracilis TaxID=150966 RepID=A0AAD3XCZ6_NEPGR|nr:hypothetical protein Nepgr_003127 [Nepenthes gracilis]
MDDSPDSPLRSNSSLRSDEPEKHSSPSSNKEGAIVAVEKYYSPLTSPLPVTPPKNAFTPDNFSNHSNSRLIKFDRAVRQGTSAPALVAEVGGEYRGVEEGVVGGRERNWKEEKFEVVDQIAGRSRREDMVKKVALGLRLSEVALCLISFSIMAADKTQGWSGDSFDRYKEYRFCLSVNVIAFLYSGFQASVLAYHLVTGKLVLNQHFHHQFDFLMDQILAYLLISASSAAASRVVDWQSNWGKDEFTEKASASISMSFLAFIAFALSSLISGYNICSHDFT